MKKALLLIFVWSVLLNFLFAQSWVQLTSTDLEVPFPETLVKHQADWYLGTPGGVFKLSGGTTSWSLVNNNLYSALGELRVEGLISSGSNLVAVNQWYGIVYSANGGTTWVASLGLNGFYYSSSNIVNIGGRLLAAIEINDGANTYIYYSDDNGVNWIQGIEVTGIYREPNIFTDGTYAYVTHSNSSDIDEFVTKTANGESLLSLGFIDPYPGSSNDNTTIESVMRSGDYLIVGGEGSLYRYDLVGAESWTDIGGNPNWVNGIVFNNLCENGSGKIFGTFLEGDMSVGFYSSTDQGDTWTEHTTSVSRGAAFAIALHAVGNEVMACFIDEGVHYTSDISTTVLALTNSGLLASDFEELFISGSNMLTSLFVSGLYGSSNSGGSWSVWSNGFPVDQELERVYGYVNNGIYLFANYSNNPDDDPDPQDLYRSADDGENWVQVNYPGALDNVKIVGNNGTVIFGKAMDGSITKYYRSVDNGDNWIQITSVPAGLTPKLIVGDGVSGAENLLFMAGVNVSNLLEVYKSSDNGDSWVLAMDGINTGDMEALYDDEDVLLITPVGKAFLKVRYSNWNYKLLTWSTDAWVQATSSNLPHNDFSAMNYYNGILFGAPYDQGVYLSYDEGGSFVSTSGLDSGLEVYDFAFIGGEAYVTTARGLWQLTIPTNINEVNITKKEILSPNPANEVVWLTVPADQVSIYSLTGDLIESKYIINNILNIEGLAKGVYIVVVYNQNESVGVVKLVKN